MGRDDPRRPTFSLGRGAAPRPLRRGASSRPPGTSCTWSCCVRDQLKSVKYFAQLLFVAPRKRSRKARRPDEQQRLPFLQQKRLTFFIFGGGPTAAQQFALSYRALQKALTISQQGPKSSQTKNTAHGFRQPRNSFQDNHTGRSRQRITDSLAVAPQEPTETTELSYEIK